MGRKDRRRKSGAGAFFGGTFFGFLLGIGAIVGIVAFAYFKVSPQWINETFNTEIDLGSEEINHKTLNDVVSIAMSIGSSTDTYSLNSFKEDFGVELPNELMGIDIQDLKSVPLAELGDAFQNKLSNLSAKEIENLFSSEALNNIMSKTTTCYYYNGALYEDEEHNTEVDFDYSIENNKVVIKSFDPISIKSDNTVEITLELLPLTSAIDVFVGNLGDNLTLRDLKTDYGVNLPSYIYDGNEDKSVNEIENIINNMYVADFLGYTINDSNSNNIIVTNGTEPVTGLMYELAIVKVEKLKNVQDKFATLTATDLEDVMDLSSLNNILSKTQTYSVVGSKLCEEGTTTEVSFEYKIEGAHVIVDNTSFEINSNEVEIVLQHLPLATAISAFTSDMGNKLTIAELADYGVTLPDFITKGNADRPIADIKTIIDDLYVADVLGYTITTDNSDPSNPIVTVTDKDEKLVTGIMGIIAQKKINQLNDIQSTIEAQTIATLMDYTIEGGVVKDKLGNTITGLLAKVAPYSILNVDDAINDLVLSDVFGTEQLNSGVLSLLGADTKVVNIPEEVDDIIQTTAINTLVEKGIIDTTKLEPDQLARLQLSIQFDVDGDDVKDSTTIGALSLQQFMIYFLTM